MLKSIALTILLSIMLSGCGTFEMAKVKNQTVDAALIRAGVIQIERAAIEANKTSLRQQMFAEYQRAFSICTDIPIAIELKRLDCTEAVFIRAMKFLNDNKPDLFTEQAIRKLVELRTELEKARTNKPPE